MWRPARWIETRQPLDVKPAEGTTKTGPSKSTRNSVLDSEHLWTPPRGSFLPWAEGDRVCPGKKFSAVELVGALTALFARGWRVEVVREEGETEEQARGRCREVIRDSGLKLLIEMLHPERVGLRWVRKEGAD